MKKITIFSFFVFIVFTNKSSCQIISIDDVEIIPSQPLPHENITIQVTGTLTHGGPQFDDSVFTIDNNNLQLDIFFTEGVGPAIPVPWSHDEEIGTLSPGSCDLLLQAYWRSSIEGNYILHDTYSTDLNVIPEPAAFLLLSCGYIWIFRNPRKRRNI